MQETCLAMNILKVLNMRRRSDMISGAFTSILSSSILWKIVRFFL